ncbi:MAG: hypothetical protein OXD46_03515, partial [Chloroflexi bacterium]|nr:hypothetical protein [Chloroflexota bacterium]
MNYYKELGLDELGIPSEEEAEELEYELELRFEDFTPKERETWLKQNVYLKHFSSIGTVTASARQAGVTVYTAQRWKHDNVLGFTRRLEVSELTFKDRLQQKALLRASDPTAPATLLIELLRANIPEKFSKNDHKCDTSKADALHRRLIANAAQERDAGYPTFKRIIQGHPNPFRPWEETHHNPNPSHTGEDTNNTHLSPVEEETQDSHLSPTGGETQRGGSPHISNSSPRVVDADFSYPTPSQGEPADSSLPPTGQDTNDPNLSPTGEYTKNSHLSPTGEYTEPSNLSPTGEYTKPSNLSPAG